MDDIIGAGRSVLVSRLYTSRGRFDSEKRCVAQISSASLPVREIIKEAYDQRELKPKFMNKYKLKQQVCDSEGVLLNLQVDEVYDVTHQDTSIQDENGNELMRTMSCEVNGSKFNIVPDAFEDFFEKV